MYGKAQARIVTDFCDYEAGKLTAFSTNERKAFTTCNPLQLYFRELKRYELLSKEEETCLAIRVKQNRDQEAYHRLVTANLRLVVKIAIDFQRYWAKNVLDLIQEGNMGLLQAVEKYDPYRGIKFSYYASFWIKAYILKFIMDNWKLVKIGTSQSQRKLFFNLNKERDKLISEGIPPEPAILAERLSVSENEVIEMSQRLGTWDISMDMPIGDASDEPFGALLRAPDMDIEEQLSLKTNRQRLFKHLRELRTTLSGREADIYDNRIMAENPTTLQEIGNKYHISRERVRQIQEKLNLRIKRWLEDKFPGFENEYFEHVYH